MNKSRCLNCARQFAVNVQTYACSSGASLPQVEVATEAWQRGGTPGYSAGCRCHLAAESNDVPEGRDSARARLFCPRHWMMSGSVVLILHGVKKLSFASPKSRNPAVHSLPIASEVSPFVPESHGIDAQFCSISIYAPVVTRLKFKS